MLREGVEGGGGLGATGSEGVGECTVLRGEGFGLVCRCCASIERRAAEEICDERTPLGGKRRDAVEVVRVEGGDHLIAAGEDGAESGERHERAGD